MNGFNARHLTTALLATCLCGAALLPRIAAAAV